MNRDTPQKPSQKTSWIYEGIWGVLSNLFCVPRDPPELPFHIAENIVARKPSPGFMQYLKLQFWVMTLVLVVSLTIGSLIVVLASENPWLLVGSLLLLGMLLFFAAVSYLSIYLRFDTTWYVFSDRSMRLRRGIWLIRESTITFENIQNVKVTQGPLQRYFGIANVVVETAGGGGNQGNPHGGSGTHAGLIEGVAEASEIRNSIMSRVQLGQSTGLGDEEDAPSGAVLSAAHLSVLREIRDVARAAAKHAG